MRNLEQKETLVIGDRVDQMCVSCGEERGHLVAMLSKTGKVTRVTCPMCHSRVRYKPTTRAASTLIASPYNRERIYRRGQTMMHPTFGEGEVTAIIEPGKIDVLFSDRIRRLIHSVT